MTKENIGVSKAAVEPVPPADINDDNASNGSGKQVACPDDNATERKGVSDAAVETVSPAGINDDNDSNGSGLPVSSIDNNATGKTGTSDAAVNPVPAGINNVDRSNAADKPESSRGDNATGNTGIGNDAASAAGSSVDHSSPVGIKQSPSGYGLCDHFAALPLLPHPKGANILLSEVRQKVKESLRSLKTTIYKMKKDGAFTSIDSYAKILDESKRITDIFDLGYYIQCLSFGRIICNKKDRGLFYEFKQLNHDWWDDLVGQFEGYECPLERYEGSGSNSSQEESDDVDEGEGKTEESDAEGVGDNDELLNEEEQATLIIAATKDYYETLTKQIRKKKKIPRGAMSVEDQFVVNAHLVEPFQTYGAPRQILTFSEYAKSSHPFVIDPLLPSRIRSVDARCLANLDFKVRRRIWTSRADSPSYPYMWLAFRYAQTSMIMLRCGNEHLTEDEKSCKKMTKPKKDLHWFADPHSIMREEVYRHQLLATNQVNQKEMSAGTNMNVLKNSMQMMAMTWACDCWDFPCNEIKTINAEDHKIVMSCVKENINLICAGATNWRAWSQVTRFPSNLDLNNWVYKAGEDIIIEKCNAKETEFFYPKGMNEFFKMWGRIFRNARIAVVCTQEWRSKFGGEHCLWITHFYIYYHLMGSLNEYTTDDFQNEESYEVPEGKKAPKPVTDGKIRFYGGEWEDYFEQVEVPGRRNALKYKYEKHMVCCNPRNHV